MHELEPPTPDAAAVEMASIMSRDELVACQRLIAQRASVEHATDIQPWLTQQADLPAMREGVGKMLAVLAGSVVPKIAAFMMLVWS